MHLVEIRKELETGNESEAGGTTCEKPLAAKIYPADLADCADHSVFQELSQGDQAGEEIRLQQPEDLAPDFSGAGGIRAGKFNSHSDPLAMSYQKPSEALLLI